MPDAEFTSPSTTVIVCRWLFPIFVTALGSAAVIIECLAVYVAFH
jgi:hypothetical protein